MRRIAMAERGRRTNATDPAPPFSLFADTRQLTPAADRHRRFTESTPAWTEAKPQRALLMRQFDCRISHNHQPLPHKRRFNLYALA